MVVVLEVSVYGGGFMDDSYSLAEIRMIWEEGRPLPRTADMIYLDDMILHTEQVIHDLAAELDAGGVRIRVRLEGYPDRDLWFARMKENLTSAPYQAKVLSVMKEW